MAPDGVSLLVAVPICSFKKGHAREYLETEVVPPPSTVYGFLLSLVGEEDRHRYLGTRIAYALLSRPRVSVILRTVWRIKNKKLPLGIGNNRRPDYQEILTQLQLGIWVERCPLATKLENAALHPRSIERFGGLSFGESHDLVNDIQWFPEWGAYHGDWILGDPKGILTLPVWVDHIGSKGTVLRQFSLEAKPLLMPSSEAPMWIRITNEDEEARKAESN